MRPPRNLQFTADDFKESGPWLRRFLTLLNEWMRDVSGALTGKLTFGDNISAQTFNLVLTASSDPVDIRTSFTTEPLEVRIVRAKTHDPALAAITAAVTCVDWEFRTGGTVRIRAISGLSAGTVYDLRVLVIGA